MKPDSWNSFGEGASLKFPITIRDHPITDANHTPPKLPEDWSPLDMEKSNLTLDKSAVDDSYLIKVLEPQRKLAEQNTIDTKIEIIKVKPGR